MVDACTAGECDGSGSCSVDLYDTCDTDTDGDGVPNSVDQCPATAPAETVDGEGCSVQDRVPCEGGDFGGPAEYLAVLTKVTFGYWISGVLSFEEALGLYASLSPCALNYQPHHPDTPPIKNTKNTKMSRSRHS